MTTYQQIINGGFKSGLFDAWTADSGVSISAIAHAGSYGCLIPNTKVISQILPNLNKAETSELTLYQKGVGGCATFTIKLTYSDETYTEVTPVTTSDWSQVDFLSYWSSGKLLVELEITNTSGSDLYIDDVSLKQTASPDRIILQTPTYILTLAHVIKFEEEQVVNPALKTVPLRPEGQVVQTDIYTCEPTELNIMARLTLTEKSTLYQIFNESAKIFITAGPWKYIGWLDKKDIRYEHSRESSTVDRDWLAEVLIVVEYIEYGEA
jgi:hypothetical protein